MGKGARNRAARRNIKTAKDCYRACSDAAVLKANITAMQAFKSEAEAARLPANGERISKLYATIATNVWRMKRQIIDAETNEPKDNLDGRAVAKLARYLTSLCGALEDAGIQIIGDYDGKPHDDGNAVKVIAYEDRADLNRDEYIETLLPTVRWTNEQGQTRLLQQAEVVVGRPAVANK
ncbi:MAG: hypothetical protein IJ802_05985 [Kiritimatiellae bacterium]|nr:hypothetical protein [Kiritimatiellia bacterium]